MKKLLTFVLTGAFALGSLSSCSKGDDNGGNGTGNGKNSKITIVTSRMGDITQGGLEDPSYFGLTGNGTAVIDWGDGSQPETITLLPLKEDHYHLDNISYSDHGGYDYFVPGMGVALIGYENYVHHVYTMQGQKTITVTGDITGLYINKSGSSIIDVSRMQGLQHLWCADENITSLDLSKNTSLKYLHCFLNQGLNSLELPQSSELKYISCRDNPNLRELDVSKNTALIMLLCFHNSFSTLDVRGCTALEVLDCGNGTIANLYVDGLTALKFLDCGCNNLTYLNLRGCLALYRLMYYNIYNRDGSKVGTNSIRQIDDLENCAELRWLDCSLNNLSFEDISGLTGRLPVLSGEEGDRGKFLYGQGTAFNYDEEIELNELLRNMNWEWR